MIYVLSNLYICKFNDLPFFFQVPRQDGLEFLVQYYEQKGSEGAWILDETEYILNPSEVNREIDAPFIQRSRRKILCLFTNGRNSKTNIAGEHMIS